MQDIKIIKAKAIYFLARREYSYLELLQKLSRYSEDTNAIRQVLNQLKEQKILSDERYIQSYLHSKSGKYSIAKLKYELYNKVDDSNLVDELIAEAKIDQYDIVLNIWQKKFGAIAKTPKDKEKQIRFLLSRGFSYDVIRTVVS